MVLQLSTLRQRLFLNINYQGSNRGKITTNGIDINVEATSALLFKTNSTTRGKFDGSGNFQIGSTPVTVIDSSRNLTNIGTISSGNITATALISDAGNNYSQVKLSGDNGTNGNSYRFSLNNNNTLLLQRSTDNFAANSTLALTIDSSQNATFAGDISLPDVKKIKLGSSDDLLLYHDSGSVIEDVGTNGLEIRTNGPDIRMIGGSNELMAKFVKDGAVELYHDNIKRLETTSSGVSMTNGLVVEGGTTFNDDANFAAALQIGGTTVTSTAAEINKLDGFTGTVTDLNYAKDLRATGVTSTEYDFLDGVTSNIQTQIDAVSTVTINNNADNRLITGSGTANTLNAQSLLTFGNSTGSGSNSSLEISGGSSHPPVLSLLNTTGSFYDRLCNYFT